MPRKVTLGNTRNIGIMAHIDAGKTTTTERILYYTGVNYKIGRTHDGIATMGWMAQEQEHGITITLAATTCYRKGSKDQLPQTRINIIGTPGHVDSIVEVEYSLHVLDDSVTIMYAKDGVEPQSETVWRQADHYKVPRMIYVNKMDVMGADFYNALNMIHDRLKHNATPIQLPIGSKDIFKGIIDLVGMDADIYYDELGKDMHVKGIPTNMLGLIQEYYTKLIGACADIDDEIMELVLEEKPIPEDMIRRVLHKDIIENLLVLMTCDAFHHNKGVQELPDAIIDLMPSPLDIPAIKDASLDTDEEDRRPADDNAPFPTLTFRIVTDPYVGRLSSFRVYSGKLTTGSSAPNSTKNQKECISRTLQMHANHRKDIEEVFSSDIAAAVGLKNTITSGTLYDDNRPIILESMGFPDPVIRAIIESKTKAGQEEMGLALVKLAEESPTFHTWIDEETSQTTIAGMGGFHPEIIVDRLSREFKVEANVGALQIAYKGTVRESVEQDTKYVYRFDGKGQYGHVRITVEPNKPGKGYEFLSEITDGVIPKEHIPAVDADIQDAMQAGALAGYPVVDVKVHLTFGPYHEVDSPKMMFRIAGPMAFKEACHKADAILLEPMMKVSVIVSDEYLDNVIGDLTSRRGVIQDQRGRPGATQADTLVPLASMFGYATDLHSSTQGRSQRSMKPRSYVGIPKSITEKITAERGRKDD